MSWVPNADVFEGDNDLTTASALVDRTEHFYKGFAQEQGKPEFDLENIGVRFVQTSSDPIHGSLGPASRLPFEPNDAQKLEAHLRTLKPRSFELEEETVKDTEKSIATAEKIAKGKMEEPYDVVKALAKTLKHAPNVAYTIHDSDDEDPETVETRKSLKTAEAMMGARFFTNESDRKKYEKMEKDGKLRPEVAEFKDKDTADVTKTAEELSADKVKKSEEKAKNVEIAELAKAEEDTKKKIEKEFIADKAKAALKKVADKEADDAEKAADATAAKPAAAAAAKPAAPAKKE